MDQWPLWILQINFLKQLPIFWANQKNLVIDCGNLKLATKNFQLPSSITRKLKIQSPIMWQSNPFFTAMHNEGPTCHDNVNMTSNAKWAHDIGFDNPVLNTN